MDQDSWRFINTFAPWLQRSAPLRQSWCRSSSRGEAIALSLRFARGFAEWLSSAASPQRVARFQCVNSFSRHPNSLGWVSRIGRRDATIMHIFWRPVPWRKSGIVLLPPSNKYSSEFPITLKDGQPQTTRPQSVSLKRTSPNTLVNLQG